MRVYTYHHNDDPPVRLLDAWGESWQRNGWEPCLLTQRHAEQHPRFDEIFEAVHKLPTVNGREYEDACYLRWLALQQVGGGLMVDYDVGNRGFRPEHLHTPAALVHLHVDRVPCAVWANKTGLRTVLEWFKNPCPPWTVNGQPHLSDMHIFAKMSSGFPIDPVCCEFNDLRTKGLPLVHFSSDTTRAVGMDKAAVMQEVCKS